MKSAMRVLTVANVKGGCGKTTLTQNLAVLLEACGHGPVVMFDIDAPQGSLSAWWNRREAETPAIAGLEGGLAELPAKLEALAAAGYRWCVIDTGPRDPFEDEKAAAPIRVADLVLIPCKTSIKDMEASAPTISYAEQQGRKFVFVLNEVKPRTSSTPQSVAALSQYGPVSPQFIGDRTVFQSADNDGRTAVELEPNGKAAEEVRGLMDFVISRFPEFKKPMKEKARV
jgi:chromosome partitioning protein